jgi:hypothetical protein
MFIFRIELFFLYIIKIYSNAKSDSRVNEPLWTVYIGDIMRNVTPYFLTLVNRNDPICVMSPKVAKASTTRVTVAGIIMGIIAGVITLTFANGNTALSSIYTKAKITLI